MTSSTSRPKRVVVVDADNPMVEVQGQFFWQEDHDALVAAARDDGYRDGYAAGWSDAARQTPAPQTLLLRPRTTLIGGLRKLLLLSTLIIGALIVFAVVAGQLFSQR
jgi:hypothetical protein